MATSSPLSAALSTQRARRVAPGAIAGVTAAALGITAAWVAHRARRAAREHPPRGRFIVHDGVRLHYLERGAGTPVVLLHGNLVDAEDYVASGLIDRLAARHRVIAIDRPGFGYSERPRDRLWTAEAQAALMQDVIRHLGLERPVVVAHSWATLIALALASRAPEDVRKLVLLSGYYFPTVRADVVLAAPPAIPIVGDVLRYTVSALFARASLNAAVKGMFAPQSVPADFLPTLDREMLVRPLQLRATGEDAAFMIPAAASMRKQYAALRVPTVLFAGADDKVVDAKQTRDLHAQLPGSELHVIPGTGHMVHYAVPDQVAAAVGAEPRRTPQVLDAQDFAHDPT